jgi:hypothetical protein
VVAGTGDDGATGSRRRGHMRASRADRERVIDILKAAYVYGLVTKDELDDRVGQTLASRTYAELALMTAGIPAGLAAAPPLLSPALAKASLRARAGARPGNRAAGAAAVLAVLVIIAACFAPNPLAGLLALGASGSAAVCLYLSGSRARGSRHGNRSGGQLPPRGATGTGPAGQRRQIRQPRRRNAADAAPGRPLRPRVST